ncbi:MAG TPA: C40 family peptidase [Acidimicrobiales bacterium]|jgi:cell wall-associated NlpC family hydrolase|nr:C40 family peptidase [Acidimicrobiales bacterium]
MSLVTRTVVIGGTVAIAVVASTTLRARQLTPTARIEIPSELVSVYKGAAQRCGGLPWQVLAAIGWVESRHGAGAIDHETGQLAKPIAGAPFDGQDGRPRIPDPRSPDGWTHPFGPMGLLPSAWAQYATLAPGRPAGATPDIQNAWDAIYTTAEELCGKAPVIVDLNRSIRGHSPDPVDVMEVLVKASRYGSGDEVPDVAALVEAASGGGDAGGGVASRATAAAAPSGNTSSVARTVVLAAARMMGVPYVWGAESPTDGFDCSGLVWWAYKEAGLSVPRTTDGLIDAGRPITSGALRPGDLLFTRGGQVVHDFGHVAIYAGGGLEVIAPRSGKSVTVQKVDLDRVQAVRRILPD